MVTTAADNCARFFSAMGEEVRALTAELGYERTQDLVGRYGSARADRPPPNELDLGELISPSTSILDLAPVDLPVGDTEPVEARAEAGLVRARPIRMEPKQASAQLAELAERLVDSPGVRLEFPRPTDANDRVLGAELAGAISRARIYDGAPEGSLDVLAELDFNGGSVAGQGFGAFNAYGLVVRVEGGAQDGVGKTMLGGTVSILKGKGANGQRSTARSASRSPTAHSEAGCSFRDRRTRAFASASPAPTWSSAASPPSRSTTRSAAFPIVPTPRGLRSST